MLKEIPLSSASAQNALLIDCKWSCLPQQPSLSSAHVVCQCLFRLLYQRQGAGCCFPNDISLPKSCSSLIIHPTAVKTGSHWLFPFLMFLVQKGQDLLLLFNTPGWLYYFFLCWYTCTWTVWKSNSIHFLTQNHIFNLTAVILQQ